MAKKIIDISNVCKLFGVVERNNYLKVVSMVFHWLTIVSSLKVICIMMKYILTTLVHFFSARISYKSFWHDENASIESNLQVVNSGNLSASNPNHVDVSGAQDIKVFIND